MCNVNVICTCSCGNVMSIPGQYDLNDNEDIRRQLRCFYGRSNMLLRTFGACSYTVKLLLFMSYCGSLYTSSIWCKYTKKQYYQMEVAYNNVIRRFFGYDRFSSASQMFVENRAENFETRMRRLIYVFRERLNASRNSLVICLMNSVAWSSSELRQKWDTCLYMQSWINLFF